MGFVDELKRLKGLADAAGRPDPPPEDELDEDAEMMAVFLRRREGFKGGEGSGHFRHAGRPGKVGGSMPGMGADRLNRILKQYVDPELQDTAMGGKLALALSRFSNQHLEGLNFISTRDFDGPDGYAINKYGMLSVAATNQGGFAGVYYRWAPEEIKRSILVAPAMIERGGLEADRIIAHELGHLVEDVRGDYEGAARQVLAYIKDGGLRKHTFGLRDAGLRDYSLTNTSELWADAYAVWRFGRDKGWQNLRELGRASKWGGDFEDYFGKRGNWARQGHWEGEKAKPKYYELTSTRIGDGLALVLEPADPTPEELEKTPWYYIEADGIEAEAKGGEGSGHFSHEGRPGKVGGSEASGRAPEDPSARPLAPEEAVETEVETEPGLEAENIPDPREEAVEAARAKIELTAKLEPAITELVTGLTEERGGKMSGLEYRLKSEESLTRKTLDDMVKDGLDAKTAAAHINDAVRYTSIFGDKTYSESILAIQKDMASAGWTQHDNKWKNFWHPGGGYMGYHTVFANPEGLTFEWQFHTPESIKVKAVSHEIYERVRAMPPSRERNQLEERMEKLWEGLKRPPKYEDLTGARI